VSHYLNLLTTKCSGSWLTDGEDLRDDIDANSEADREALPPGDVPTQKTIRDVLPLQRETSHTIFCASALPARRDSKKASEQPQSSKRHAVRRARSGLLMQM